MVILGIDPGKAETGWGVIKTTKKKMVCLGYGVIKTPAGLKDPERLRMIFNEISRIFREYEPDHLAVETLYFVKNRKTAMGVAQARGVVLLAGARKKVPTQDFTPLEIKMAICGYGRAKKSQVQKMIKKLLNLEKVPRPNDAADALGAAICLARTLNSKI